MAEYWMARTGISKHPKAYRLAEALGVDDAAGLGYMTGLYDFTAAYRERGHLGGLTHREIARGCGWFGDAVTFIDALRTAGLLDGDVVHDWIAIQGPSLDARDKARERMRDHRSRHVTRTDNRTVREQYLERSEDQSFSLSSKQSKEPPLPPKGDLPAKAAPNEAWVLETWNARVEPPVRRAQAISGSRARAAHTRLAEPGFRDAWPKVCERINASPFCRGENPRGWTAGIDFALRAGVWQRVIEGEFDALSPKNADAFDRAWKSAK